MKFDQEKNGFQPVTITLETEKEVQVLAAALGRVSGSGVDDGVIYAIYTNLTDVVEYEGAYQGYGTVGIEEV